MKKFDAMLRDIFVGDSISCIAQMDQEGHKILKIVMTRRLTGKPDNRSYTADCWQRVSSIILSFENFNMI